MILYVITKSIISYHNIKLCQPTANPSPHTLFHLAWTATLASAILSCAGAVPWFPRRSKNRAETIPLVVGL